MTKSDPVRVMIVDDHAVVCNGIRYSLLAFPDLELVAESAAPGAGLGDDPPPPGAKTIGLSRVIR